MKNLILSLVIFFGLIMQVQAYDFQSGNLLYTINNTDQPEVRLVGHVNGTAAQGELVIPETVTYDGITYLVTIIGKRAFSGCQHLTGSLVIPNSVVEIMGAAFYECVGFTGDLVIPNSVTKINIDTSPENTVPGAFENCTGFNGHLVLSNSLEIIGDAQGGGCFRGCNNLIGELVLPNTLSYIGESAFEGCVGLTGILVIPESVTEICHYAFSGCLGIENVIFSDIPLIKGTFLFSGCTSLTNITIPEGWTSTGEYTFAYCTSLKEVILPESLTVIEGGSFSDCPNLVSINFPEGIKEIFNNAFGNCTSLESIDLPEDLDLISLSAFAGCTGLSGKVVVPAKELRRRAFRSCTGITHLVLGKAMNYIPELAFEDTNIETMTIMAIVPPELDTRGGWHFDRNLPITVPCGTLGAYQNAEGWEEFTNMQEGVTTSLLAISANENAGFVAVLNEATCEDKSVQVEALPNVGFEFLYWEANGEQVSTDNPFTFELEADTKLIAHFTGMGGNEIGQLFSVYPNPVKNQLHMQFSPDVQPKQVELYDLQGRLVRTQRSNFGSIDMSRLPAGTYTLRVTMDDGTVFSDKVVRE